MIKKTLLKNNILLITESSEKTKTVSIGFWFRVGSRLEKDGERGISHLTEHMIFKGTDKRSAHDIAVTFDRAGGFANAFTEKENVCMHFTVPAIGTNVKDALTVFCDMAQNAIFSEEELAREKEVVKREIISVREDPEEAALDEVDSFVWKDKGLSKNISGDENDVDCITRNALVEWYKKYFVEGNLTVTAAGCFDEQELIQVLETLSPKKNPVMGNKINEQNTISEGSAKKIFPLEDSWSSGNRFIKSSFQQEQFFLLYPYPMPFTEKEYWSLVIFNAMAGDTMSSRLFESLREKTGFCYNVYSFFTIYENETAWCAYASSDKKKSLAVIEILKKEIELLAQGKITEEDVALAKKHIEGEETISSEDSDYLMKRLYRNNEMHFSLKDTDDTIKLIDGINLEDIKKASEKLLQAKNRAFVVYGPKLGTANLKKAKTLLEIR